MNLGDAVLQVIPLALGVAASPLPVVAVIVILLTERARMSSVLFSAAWIVGNFVAITFAVMFAGRVEVPKAGFDIPFEGAITLLLGVGLLVIGWLSRRGRYQSLAPDTPPSWVHSVDNLSPWGGVLVAFTNATTSPKNLALALAAGAIIQISNPRPVSILVSELLYVAVASITVVGPVVVYFVGGDKSTTILLRWKQRITANAAAFMEMLLFVLGAVLALKGVVNLLT